MLPVREPDLAVDHPDHRRSDHGKYNRPQRAGRLAGAIAAEQAGQHLRGTRRWRGVRRTHWDSPDEAEPGRCRTSTHASALMVACTLPVLSLSSKYREP